MPLAALFAGSRDRSESDTRADPVSPSPVVRG